MSWRPGSLAVRARRARIASELEWRSWRLQVFWAEVFARLRRFSR